MKISVHLDRDEEEDSPATTGRKDSTLQSIHERVRSQQDPYYSGKIGTSRRGAGGVVAAVDGTRSEQTPSFATKLLSFGRMRGTSPNEENGSLLGSVLSVATTPLRAAWGMVASRSSPAQHEVVEAADGLVNGSREAIVEDVPEVVLKEDSCIGEDVKQKTPSPRGAVEVRKDVGGSPKMHTPFDGVLGMLKEGPLAGGTPLRFPSPKKSTVKTHAQAAPGSVLRGQAFTFDSTKKNLTSLQKFRNAASKAETTPQHKVGVQKSTVFGSMRGSMAARGSATPLAWTPLRATPLAQSTSSRLFTRKSRFDETQEVSRKRRADDVHGMTPSVEDGSVSLLDMQRRRRFKPSEDPGSTQRRSWRAGRTPYRHVSHYKRRIDSANKEKPGETLVEPSPSSRPTSETARRILETLDSMEQSIRKSKEPLTPSDARKYTASATAPPPPGTSLGGIMLPRKEPEVAQEKKHPEVAQEKKEPVFTFASKKPTEEPKKDTPPVEVEIIEEKSPEEPVQASKKSKRRATDELERAPKPSSTLGKPSSGAFDFVSSTKIVQQAPVSPKEKDSEEVYVFGKAKNPLKDSVSKVVQGVLPSFDDRSTFTFGKDKISASTEPAHDTQPIINSGWGGDSLKKNVEVTAAVEKETNNKTDTPTTFAFGTSSSVSPVIKFGTPTPEKKTEESQQPLANAGWGSDFLKKNAEAAAEVTAAVEKEVNKDTTPSTGAASTPAFTFGASSTPASTFKFGSSAVEEKKPEEPKPAATTGGWGSGFSNTTTTNDIGGKTSADAPSFNFGTASQVPSSEPVKSGTSGFGGTFGTQSMDDGAAKVDSAFNATQTNLTFGQPPKATAPTGMSGSGFNSGQNGPAQFAFGASSGQQGVFGSTAPANTGLAFGGTSGSQPTFGGFGATVNTSFDSGKNDSAWSGGFGGNTAAFGNQGAGFGSSGFGSSAQTSAPFGTSSSAGAFGAPPPVNAFGNTNAFGQPGTGQFGAPQNTGFGGAFAGPSAFPQPSAAGQMIPNQDNPFGGGVPSAGGFSLGSSGTTSEGRRKVKVKRRAR